MPLTLRLERTFALWLPNSNAPTAAIGAQRPTAANRAIHLESYTAPSRTNATLNA